eukprot:14654468-Alexandrium_andersonii.AAC.1
MDPGDGSRARGPSEVVGSTGNLRALANRSPRARGILSAWHAPPASRQLRRGSPLERELPLVKSKQGPLMQVSRPMEGCCNNVSRPRRGSYGQAAARLRQG